MQDVIEAVVGEPRERTFLTSLALEEDACHAAEIGSEREVLAGRPETVAGSVLDLADEFAVITPRAAPKRFGIMHCIFYVSC